MTFAKKMLEAKKKLEKMGHVVNLPPDAREVTDGKINHDDLDADYEHCVKNDIIKRQFDFIDKSDAVLVLNYNKNDTNGYIGTSSLMEIGVAHHLGKKIFLLNPIPHHSEHRWVHEVRIIQPIILNGDLDKITFSTQT
jgi:nucleoside 2-deoxyribosyltransferase